MARPQIGSIVPNVTFNTGFTTVSIFGFNFFPLATLHCMFGTLTVIPYHVSDTILIMKAPVQDQYGTYVVKCTVNNQA
jgi:hypothetical protein